MKKIYISFITLLFMHFSYAQTSILSKDYTNLSNWDIKSGELKISNGIVSTEGDDKMTLAFMNLDKSIQKGEILKVTFKSNDVTKFATGGWAGLSLYTGGSSGKEQIFIGSPGNSSSWGVDGAAISKTVLSKTSELVDVEFSYNYDDGNWSINVDGEIKTGTIAPNLAFDAIRLGADINNNADLAISNLSISTTSIVTEISTTEAKTKIELFPNPSVNFIQFSGLNEAQQFSVFDILGTKISEGLISPNEQISTANLNSGVYFVVLENGKVYTFTKE